MYGEFLIRQVRADVVAQLCSCYSALHAGEGIRQLYRAVVSVAEDVYKRQVENRNPIEKQKFLC